MFETMIVSFTTFFATIGPIDVAVMFAAMTPKATTEFRRIMALRGIFVASAILFLFAFAGDFILNSMGISLAALKVSGGVLLLLIAIDMVFARHSGGTSTTAIEDNEASGKEDISIVPLATPLIAGPGAMGAAILLMANVSGDVVAEAMVLVGLLLVLLLTLLLLLVSTQVQRIFGVTGMQVVSRVFGVLLAALAVQFMFDGLLRSGLLGG